MIGALLFAGFSFFIGRVAGKDFIQKLLGKKTKYLNNKIDNFGIRIIAIVRAAFIVPFDILSYAVGLTKMKFNHFILGTFLGIVAEVFSLAYLGHNLKRPHSKAF